MINPPLFLCTGCWDILLICFSADHILHKYHLVSTYFQRISEESSSYHHLNVAKITHALHSRGYLQSRHQPIEKIKICKGRNPELRARAGYCSSVASTVAATKSCTA